MTREERKKAIKVLDDMKVKIDVPKAAKMQNDKNWALDMAIKALEQEPCEDAISREDKKHIDGFKYWCETNEENGTITIPKFVCDKIVKILDKLLPVTPSRRKGKCYDYRNDNRRTDNT